MNRNNIDEKMYEIKKKRGKNINDWPTGAQKIERIAVNIDKLSYRTQTVIEKISK